MKKRVIIPNTDLEVFPMGLGTVDAGIKWDGQDAYNIFDMYLDQGGNLIDTAHVYSDWAKPEIARSERVIGDWLSLTKKRNHIVLMTKGGHPDMTVDKPDMHRSRMAKDDMIKDLDSSLMKLRTDHIDVYFYHRDDESISVADLIETMEGFVKEGKIRYYACSNWSVARMKEADSYCKEKAYRGIVGNQALFNLGTKHMNPPSDDTLEIMNQEMNEYHKENKNNVMVPYSGVANGFFHKYITQGEELVKRSPYYTKENIRIGKRLLELMKEYDASVSQVVLGYFSQQDFLCVPLYGPRNPEQVKEAMKTFDINFKKKDYIL